MLAVSPDPYAFGVLNAPHSSTLPAVAASTNAQWLIVPQSPEASVNVIAAPLDLAPPLAAGKLVLLLVIA